MSKFLGWCAVALAAPVLGIVVMVCGVMFVCALILEWAMGRRPDFSWWHEGTKI